MKILYGIFIPQATRTAAQAGFHLSTAALAMVFNLYSLVKEYRLICENAMMIAELNQLIAQTQRSPSSAKT